MINLDISKAFIKYKDVWKRIFFILVDEYGWSQEDIESTDIPFILIIIQQREKKLEQERKAMARKK